MGLLDLTTVSTTEETKPINGWVYRIIQDDRGAILMRVPEDERFWGHGVIKQMYLADEKQFVPACKAGLNVRLSYADAITAILVERDSLVNC